MNNRVKKIIKDWSQQSKNQEDNLNKFISLWIAFNAWGSNMSNSNKDYKIINWVKQLESRILD